MNETCGNCINFSAKGCEPATEYLVMSGYPRPDAVQVRHDADASRCPDYEPDTTRCAEEREMRNEKFRAVSPW